LHDAGGPTEAEPAQRGTLLLGAPYLDHGGLKSELPRCFLCCLTQQHSQHNQPATTPSPYILKEAMPDFPKGERLEARVRPITLQPGMGDWHTHPTPIVIYVLEGTFAVEIKDKGVTHVKAGEAVLEQPNVVLRGGNLGQTQTKVIVFQVASPEAPFSQPAPSQ
jgi:quercetin dioxygenase-like cupin family protein